MEEEILDVIRARRSIRSFLPDEVNDNEIAQIITAATLAPSAGNAQPWYFYLVRDDYVKRQLVNAALNQSFIAQAPVVVVVCADLVKAKSAYRKRGEELYCLQDTAAATQNMLLTAHSLGLGTCWIGSFDESLVSKALSLPPFHRPVAIVPIGRPNENPPNPGRRPLDQIFSEID